MVLEDTISGKSLLSIIITVSPDEDNVGESFSSLRFASDIMKLEVSAYVQRKTQ